MKNMESSVIQDLKKQLYCQMEEFVILIVR